MLQSRIFAAYIHHLDFDALLPMLSGPSWMDIDITYIPCEWIAGSWNGFETGQIITVQDNC